MCYRLVLANTLRHTNKTRRFHPRNDIAALHFYAEIWRVDLHTSCSLYFFVFVLEQYVRAFLRIGLADHCDPSVYPWSVSFL